MAAAPTDNAYEVTDYDGEEYQFTAAQAARRHDMHSATGRNPYANAQQTEENVDMGDNDEQPPAEEGIIMAPTVTVTSSASSWA